MNIYYDILITKLIVITALPAVILLRHRYWTKDSWEQRHKYISLILAILLLIGTAVVTFGSFVEPKLLVLNERSIDLPHIEKPIKIALIADPQVGPYRKTKWIKKISKKILSYKPDIVLIAGDLVNNGSKKFGTDETIYLEPFRELANQIPTYSVIGNHAYGVNKYDSNKPADFKFPSVVEDVIEKTKTLKIRHLVNETELITIRGQSFYLFGADSLWAGKLNYDSLNDREEDLPTIMLVHNQAAIFEASEHNIDLVFAGHTHGGQIRLPIVGPVALVDDITPRKWYQGLNNHNGTKLFVTSGLGETGTRARLFNPPEIVMITIK